MNWLYRWIARIAALLAALSGLMLSAPALALDDKHSSPEESAPTNDFGELKAKVKAQEATEAIIAEPAASEPVPPEADVRPALWKISDEDTTIYVFGTVHILPPNITWFDGPVAAAFGESEELVTEVVASDDPAAGASFLKTAMLPADKNLRELLSDQERAAYEAGLASLKMPPGAFDRFEPWYAALLLSSLPILAEGFDTKNGVEEILGGKAKARAIPQHGLETAEYQLSLFDMLPMDVQTRYLGEVISQLPTIKSDIDEMIAAWKGGDAETLASLMNSQETDPVLIETLLLNRNRSWAAWVISRLGRPGTVFLAVGAGHLSGAGSLNEQLAQLGIVSERIQ